MREDVGKWGREGEIEEDLMEGLHWMDQGDQELASGSEGGRLAVGLTLLVLSA